MAVVIVIGLEFSNKNTQLLIGSDVYIRTIYNTCLIF